MQLATVVLGCLIVGQTPADGIAPPAAPERPPIVLTPPERLSPPETLRPIAQPENAPAAEGVLPSDPPDALAGDEPLLGEPKNAADAPRSIEPTQLRSTPPEMVAEALVLPSGGRLSGRPMTLRRAVSSTADRARQLEVIHAYWRLVEAVAEYRFALSHNEQLRQYGAGEGNRPEPAALLRMVRADSAASVQDAELQATAAQHELAALARLPADSSLPLPADRPHVGPYRTNFGQVYSRRSAPARARLIDRTLPIRCRAIDSRAAAVHAARDALDAAVRNGTAGQADPATVLACMGRHLHQQRAFMAAVCRYNRDIADYALAVAGPGAGGEVLVGMLIKPARTRLRPLVSDVPAAEPSRPIESSRVEPAGLDQPVPTPAKRQTDGQRPTLLDDPAAAPGRIRPIPAAQWVPSGAAERPAPKLAPLRAEPIPSGRKEPTPAPPRPKSIVQPPPEEEEIQEEEVQQGEVEEEEESAAAATPAEGTLPVSSTLYSGLLEADPARQAEQLAITLHWDRTLPVGIGEPMSLAECLQTGPAGKHRETIDAYWLVRQRAAEYQVLVQHAELLDTLGLTDAMQPPEPSDSVGMLSLRSAGLSTEAALGEAHAALIEAQLALAVRLGRAADPAWPMPTTAPLAGPYRLLAQGPVGRRPASWTMRRLTATIPGLASGVQRRATVVVESDAVRGAAASDYQAGRRSIRPVLEEIRRQTEQTFAFLETLTAYNRAIAEYALTVLPPETSADDLLATLAVESE